ncbi:MAG: molybdate ABC transporter substrate-binding protein [Chloroflexi bacterium]|nr:molybdate ABC transporter substrate-binding protein [Chloroflexota bacterium]
MAPRLLRILSGSAVAAAAIASGAGCGQGGGKPEITVAAASDLRPAFEALEPAFERACACRLTLSFGSSGTFATQIQEGLPVDVFASANAAYVDQLSAEGLIAKNSRTTYAVGRIVLATRGGEANAPATIEDLVDPRFERIAIANPEHAPYGLAAKQALTSVGLWDTVEPRLVLAENASQAAQFVESGDADAGIVPLSLAIQSGGGLEYELIDEALHEPLEQVAAVIARSGEHELAGDFIAFINGPEGRPVMLEFGFALPGEAR